MSLPGKEGVWHVNIWEKRKNNHWEVPFILSLYPVNLSLNIDCKHAFNHLQKVILGLRHPSQSEDSQLYCKKEC